MDETIPINVWRDRDGTIMEDEDLTFYIRDHWFKQLIHLTCEGINYIDLKTNERTICPLNLAHLKSFEGRAKKKAQMELDTRIYTHTHERVEIVLRLRSI